MRSSRSAVLAVAVAASLIAGACSSGASPSASSAPPASASSSSASASASGKQLTIGFVVPLISNPYWKVMQDFAVGAAQVLGIKLLTGQANSDESTEINIVEGWISAKVDGIVVGPVSDKVGQAVLTDAKAANIPVVFMQRAPGVDPSASPSNIYVGFVGTDDVTAGVTAATALYATGARKWVAMTGDQGNSVATDRLKGMQQFVSSHPDVKVLKTQFGNEARSSGQQTMENFLSALPGPGFDGVFSFNDEGALGAIQALSNAGDLNKVKVAMIDGTPDGLTAVGKGQAIVTVSGGTACGAFALVELFDFLNGHPPNNRVWLQPLISVTPQNVQAYESQVINGAANYDFKAISQVFNPSASTTDYKITLK